MLTKDLVRYRVRKDKIHPRFIDPDNRDLLETAAELIFIFENGEGQSREAISEQTAQIIDASPCEAIISRGFEKLLFDRTEFQEPVDEDMPALRDTVFSQTSQALVEQSFDDRQAFEDWVAQNFGKPAKELGKLLYSDLPGLHPLVEFKPIKPLQLMHRYNTAQVQWLLLNAHRLTVTLTETTPAAMRQLLKYLRFTQLLAHTSRSGKSWKLEIDGPMNLFANTKRYGMNLARFFPALLHQKKWRLETQLQLGPRLKPTLQLDHKSRLQPERERFHAYVPKEIERFRSSLKKRMEDWKCESTPGFVPLEGEHLCFPDFTLTHSSGRQTSIELFHPWHASHFTARLAQLEHLDDAPLILGLDHKLSKDKLIVETIAASSYFNRYGFTFRDIPTIQKLSPILDRLAPS